MVMKSALYVFIYVSSIFYIIMSCSCVVWQHFDYEPNISLFLFRGMSQSVLLKYLSLVYVEETFNESLNLVFTSLASPIQLYCYFFLPKLFNVIQWIQSNALQSAANEDFSPCPSNRNKMFDKLKHLRVRQMGTFSIVLVTSKHTPNTLLTIYYSIRSQRHNAHVTNLIDTEALTVRYSSVKQMINLM